MYIYMCVYNIYVYTYIYIYMVGPPMYLPFLTFSCVQVTWLQIYTATVASDCKGQIFAANNQTKTNKKTKPKNQNNQNSRTFWIIDSSRRIVCLVFCIFLVWVFWFGFFVGFLVWCFWFIYFCFWDFLCVCSSRFLYL